MTYTQNGSHPQTQQTSGQAPPPSQVARTKTRASGATRRGKDWLLLLVDNKISLAEFSFVLAAGYFTSLGLDLMTGWGFMAKNGSAYRLNLYVGIYGGIIALLMLCYLVTNARGGKVPVWTANVGSFAIGLGIQPYLTEWLLILIGVSK